MGGSSLAPEVMQRMFASAPGALDLVVLDTTNPTQVLETQARLDMDRTLFIASSKSGTTIETISQLEYFWSQRPIAGQFVAITDKGSYLHRLGDERGFRRVFLNRPDVGGRYSGLTLFGLVPGALIGVDLQAELEAAAGYIAARQDDAVLDGIRLGEAARAGFDKVTFRLPAYERPFAWWAEQLLAESTGKDGKGLLPVEGEPAVDPRCFGPDRIFVGGPAAFESEHPVLEWQGWQGLATFWHWEFATAVAGHVLGVNPFDQQSVQEAKDATNRILAGHAMESATPPLPEVLADIRPGDYIALLAYLPRNHANDARLVRVRHRLLEHFHVATTSGFGPRYLHSTGQYHKGGPNTGLFVQVVEPRGADLPIPGTPYSFGDLHEAQALGDLASLRSRGRRVARTTLAELEQFASGL
jgi:hypothetical protein